MKNKFCHCYTKIELLLAIILISIGILLRIKVYSANLPFWVDEDALIRNALGILKGIYPCYRGLEAEYSPPFFFFIARYLYKFYGLNEMALRIIPLTASILYLPLFAFLAKKLIKTPFLFLFPLCFISINDELIFHSQNFKFYSTDFLCSIIILLLIFHIKNFDFKHVVLYSLTALILSGSAYSSIFFLTGISSCIFIKLLFNPNKENWKKYIVFNVPWVIFTFLYVTELLTRRTNYDYLYEAWAEQGNFIPKTIYDFSNLLFYHTGIWPNKSIIIIMWGIIIICGLFMMYKKYHFKAICFISPVLIMLLAGAAEKFPFIGRQTLYLMPVFLILTYNAIDFSEWKKINKYLLIFPFTISIFIISYFNYDLSYVKSIWTNPNHCRMSTAKEFYNYLQTNYTRGQKIYSVKRDASLRIYDIDNNLIDFNNDVEEGLDFIPFIQKVNPKTIVHIYIFDYPYIGTTNSENYDYIKKHCKIIKEVDDNKGKYVILKKQ